METKEFKQKELIREFQEKVNPLYKRISELHSRMPIKYIWDEKEKQLKVIYGDSVMDEMIAIEKEIENINKEYSQKINSL